MRVEAGSSSKSYRTRHAVFPGNAHFSLDCCSNGNCMAQSSWKESVHQAKCTGCIAHRAFSAPRLQKKARLNQKHTSGTATNWRDYQNIDWQPKKRCNQLKATKIEDLAAAHQYESNISPPAALLCIPTTADSISGVIQVDYSLSEVWSIS